MRCFLEGAYRFGYHMGPFWVCCKSFASGLKCSMVMHPWMQDDGKVQLTFGLRTLLDTVKYTAK